MLSYFLILSHILEISYVIIVPTLHWLNHFFYFINHFLYYFMISSDIFEIYSVILVHTLR
jgi:hypothetical protein